MKMHPFATGMAIAIIGTTAGLAQYPLGAVGFYVSTNLGHTAGSACWWFSCTPATVSVTAGEIVTLRINGDHLAPYLLATSPTATSCVAYSGILHNLVLDMPATIIASGTLSSMGGPLACPNGFDTLVATVPPSIPLGTTIAIQSLTYGAGSALAFTGAIVLTII
jgi:hypothetical protein